MKTQDEMLNLLEQKYPKMFLKPSEQFGASYKGGIWSSGENGDLAKDGFKLFNYYAEDPKERRYVLGVHKEIGNFLEKHGWYAEWYDCGTIMLWPI
jgi:hypothetical protein